MHQTKLSRNLLITNSAILMACAVFDFAFRDTVLVLMLLFLPFIDSGWSVQFNRSYPYRFHLILVTACLISVLCLVDADAMKVMLASIFLIALPEEWFFRAYVMQRLESLYQYKHSANVLSSGFFALLHLPTQGWPGLSVFVPSLFLGWLFQQKRDFILLVLVHALFNIVFMVFLKDRLPW